MDFCQIIWQILNYTEQNKFCQKLSPVGFELTTSRSSVLCSTTVLSHYPLWMGITMAFIKSCSIGSRQEQSPTCEVVHETKESSLQTSPTDCLLAQLVEHGTDDLELVIVQTPLGNNIWWTFILCSVTLDLSDNVTEIRLKGLTWKTQMTWPNQWLNPLCWG